MKFKTTFELCCRRDYRGLQACMARYPPLVHSQERLWAQIIEYYRYKRLSKMGGFSFKAGFPIFRYSIWRIYFASTRIIPSFATSPRNFEQSSQTAGECKGNAPFMGVIEGKANACQPEKTPKLSVYGSLCEEFLVLGEEEEWVIPGEGTPESSWRGTPPI